MLENVVVLVEDGHPGGPLGLYEGMPLHGAGPVRLHGDARPDHDLPASRCAPSPATRPTWCTRCASPSSTRSATTSASTTTGSTSSATAERGLPGLAAVSRPGPGGVDCRRGLPPQAAERRRGASSSTSVPTGSPSCRPGLAAGRRHRARHRRPRRVEGTVGTGLSILRAGPDPGRAGCGSRRARRVEHHQLRAHHRPARSAGRACWPSAASRSRSSGSTPCSSTSRSSSGWSAPATSRSSRRASGAAQTFSNIRRPDVVQREIYVQMEDNENRKFDRIAAGARRRRLSAADAGRASCHDLLPAGRHHARPSSRPRRPACWAERLTGGAPTTAAGRQPGPVGHRDAGRVGPSAGGLHPLLRAARHRGTSAAPSDPGSRRDRRPRPRPGGDVRRGEPARGRTTRWSPPAWRCTSRSPRSVADVAPRARRPWPTAVAAPPPEPRSPAAPAPAPARPGLRPDLAPAVDGARRRHLRRVGARRRRLGRRLGRRPGALPRGHRRGGAGAARPTSCSPRPSRGRSRPTTCPTWRRRSAAAAVVVDGQDLFWWGVRTRTRGGAPRRGRRRPPPTRPSADGATAAGCPRSADGRPTSGRGRRAGRSARRP